MRISICPSAHVGASNVISTQTTCSFPAFLLVTLRRMPPWECTPIFIAKGPKENLRSLEPVHLPPVLLPQGRSATFDFGANSDEKLRQDKGQVISPNLMPQLCLRISSVNRNDTDDYGNRS